MVWHLVWITVYVFVVLDSGKGIERHAMKVWATFFARADAVQVVKDEEE